MSKVIFIQEDNIKREATQQELEQMEIDRITHEAYEAERLAAEEEKENLKAAANAKLAALGLTADEIAAITS